MAILSEDRWQEKLKALIHESSYELAEEICYERLREDPSDQTCLIGLGQIAWEKGDLRDAVIMYRKAIEASPEKIEPWVLLSGALIEKQELILAEDALGQALSLNSDHTEARKLLAYLYASTDRIALAVEIFESLRKENGDDPVILEGLGNTYRMLGRRESAVDVYRSWAGLQPQDGNAWWSLANLKNYTFSEEEIQQMRESLSLAEGSESQMHFALGQAFEDRGKFGTAFEHYRKANQLAKDRESFVMSEHEALIDRLLSFNWNLDLEYEPETTVPIFIVGMPRSGSTLIEQILASHSAVVGMGELSALGDLVGELEEESGNSYPDLLSGFDLGGLRELGRKYLEVVKPSSGIFVDKMPNNFILIGLIRLILPQAKVIHSKRHPIATCFSCFKQRFGRGQTYSYDLSDLSQYYMHYSRLMDFWHFQYPGEILDVEYDTLVRSPDKVIRGVLDFCGVPFEESCLDFHKTSRVINSASSEQVREPLYRNSLDQWQYFEPFLTALTEPLSELLP